MLIMDIHRGPQEIDLTSITGVICDIDGTIADNKHRAVWVSSKPKNWKAYNKTMDQDTPIEWVIDIIQEFTVKGVPVIFCSGREEIYRDVTQAWINDHTGLREAPLYMRGKKDYRRDDQVKSELYDTILADGFTPNLILDDRNQVVDMWRQRGLNCIQVAEGDF